MNVLKRKLQDNVVTTGGWIQIGHPSIARIFAHAGFDWICIDLQHGIINKETIRDMITAIERYGKVPVIRLPVYSCSEVGSYLDMGVLGIIVPDIRSVDDVANVIKTCKYPPDGIRSFGYCQANVYGAEFESYISRANKEISIIAQIEHTDALNNIHGILSLDGLDATFIGPLDLKGSVDIEMNGMLFDQMTSKYLNACETHHKPAGIHVLDPSLIAINTAVEQGYKMIAVGTDGIFLNQMAKEVIKYEL